MSSRCDPSRTAGRRWLASRAACALVVLTLVGACGRTASSERTTAGTRDGAAAPTVRIGLAIPSHVHAVAWIASDAGYFEREGVEAEVQVLGGSAAAVQALLGDALDVAIAGGDSALKANAAGGDVVVVAGFVHRFYHQLVARKATKQIGDLRGRRVGLPFPGGPQDMAVSYVLRKAGMSAGDVETASLGKDFNLLAALVRGDIDAAPAQTSAKKLEELGLHVLADPTRDAVEFPYAMALVRRAYLEKDRPAVLRTLAALCVATRQYADPSSDGATAKTLTRKLGPSDAHALAERMENAGRKFLTVPPLPRRSSLVSARLLMAAKQPADPGQKPGSDDGALTEADRQLIDRTFDDGVVTELVRSERCRLPGRP